MDDVGLSPSTSTSTSSSEDVILVLRAGDAPPEVAEAHGEFAEWIERAVGDTWSGAWEEYDLRSSLPLPDFASVAAIIITGSIASVTERAPWMLRTEAYLREVVAAETPLLGICFGHQIMAQALGGEVQRNPRGREMGTVEVTRMSDDPLFDGIPAVLGANASHVDTVVKLPHGARILATTSLEEHAAVAFGASARGVQFHPEIDKSVMRGYVEVRKPCLMQEGYDAETILAGTSETPHARELLRNFIRHFVVAKVQRAA
jgi:GMP synthase (glutamine-hydrolysing)